MERHSKPIAAIISYEDLKRLEALEDVLDSALYLHLNGSQN
jgi:hypothetical protein